MEQTTITQMRLFVACVSARVVSNSTMMRSMVKHTVLLSSLMAAVPLVVALGPCTAMAAPAEYSAKGVIKSFGPERAFVLIAHEEIKGYMMAMTMPFEPHTPTQLQQLSVGDKVSFRFQEMGDGRRVLLSIQKEPAR